MRHDLLPSINTLFSRQSHCINCGGIRPFYFSLTGQQCKYILNQRMGLLRKTDINIDLIFMQKQINKCQKFFKLHGQGSSQQNLSKGDILKFILLAPNLPEQQKIAACLTSLDDLIIAQAQKLDTLKTHKKGMMQRLFPTAKEAI